MSEGLLWRALRALLFLLPAETAHRVTFGLLRLVPPRLLPVGLAAGFDKDAEGFRQLLALGFGFVEVGTVTPRPQPGNPKPRLFRLKADRALVNRMGFNSHGIEPARGRLTGRAERVVGVNIGRNKETSDAVGGFATAARELGALGDYVAVNVSSPNTPGLRDLQAVEQLRPLLAAVQRETDRPVLVKIAPDLADEDVDAVCDLALELGLAGIIATNTTIARDGLRDPAATEVGGLSGAPVGQRSLAVLRRLHARASGRLVLVAAGGIETADDAWERIRAGATLVQLYTGFVFGGPGTPRRLAEGLAERARAGGFSSVQAAVGTHSRGV